MRGERGHLPTGDRPALGPDHVVGRLNRQTGRGSCEGRREWGEATEKVGTQKERIGTRHSYRGTVNREETCGRHAPRKFGYQKDVGAGKGRPLGTSWSVGAGSVATVADDPAVNTKSGKKKKNRRTEVSPPATVPIVGWVSGNDWWVALIEPQYGIEKRTTRSGS